MTAAQCSSDIGRGLKNPDGGFARDWVQFHVRNVERLSVRRLAAAYRCTYLNHRTLSAMRWILDAGCGGGFFVRYLEQSGLPVSYVGIDRSTASVSAARARFPQQPFLLADVQQLPFEANRFDLAYARDVVIHAPAPYQALNELYRVARHMVLRIRVAEIPSLFTARYRQREFVHHFFPLHEMVKVLQALAPAPRWIRYTVNTWRRRPFDPTQFRHPAPFSSYCAADLFIAKGPPENTITRVMDDTSYSVLQAVRRRLQSGLSFVVA